MTEPTTPDEPGGTGSSAASVPPVPPQAPQPPPPPPQAAASAQQFDYPPAPQPGYPPAPMGAPPLGQVRSTGMSIFLFFITLGFYGWYWYYAVHDEMKRHTGRGIGGGIALLIAILVGIAMPYLTSDEVGKLYEARGQAKPVSALTGLWSFPGALILVGPFIWFVKTNRALNAYWESLGVQR
ncbi:MAG: DUF4234 domain-containing protein [Actinomycetes bacterium]